MAEYPLDRTTAQRLPYVDPDTLEDRTRPARPGPRLFGRPTTPRLTAAGPTTARPDARASVRARDLLRSLTRATRRA